jgi:hypothetical protein
LIFRFFQFSNAPSSFEITDEGEKSEGANNGNHGNRNGLQQELHIKFSSPWEKETIEIISNYDETYMKNLESELGIKLQVRYE